MPASHCSYKQCVSHCQLVPWHAHDSFVSSKKHLSLFSKERASNSNLLHVIKNSLLVCGTSSQNIPQHAPPHLQSPYFKKQKKKEKRKKR